MPGVFITGAASGIGLATARLMAERGWCVVAADVNAAALEEAFRDTGVISMCCDVRDSAAVEAAVRQADVAAGGLTAAVVNAGVHARNSVLDFTDADLDRLTDINIKGSAYTLRAVAHVLRENGGGSIVLTASDQAFIGKPGNFTYGLTKGAIAQMTRTAALELAPCGIRVNAVCPGTVATPFVDEIFENAAVDSADIEAMWADERALFPLKRVAQPDEVARAIYFMLVDATFSTGSLLKVDGGLTAG